MIKRKQIAGMNQNYRQYSYDYFLESQAMAGYQSVELWLGAPHFWVDSCSWSDCKTIRQKTNAVGLAIVAATTPSGGAFQYQYGAQESFHRERSIDYFSNGVRLTAELGAKIMTINSGWGYWNDKFDTAFARSAEIINAVAEVAQTEGVMLALESLTGDETRTGYTIDQIKSLVAVVDSPSLYLMVDIVATGYSKEKSQQWFDAFGEKVIHYHFQDGDVTNPSAEHYVWGDGEFKLEEEMKCLLHNDYRGYLTQEICGSSDPRKDDIRNMRVLSRFLED